MSFFDNLFKIENETSVSGLNSELKAIYIYDENNYEKITQLAKRNIELSKDNWNMFETSWD